MFKNYLVTAYRNLLRFKLDSALNISGLVIGLSAALLIALFVQNEHSYDQFWQDSERLYRIQTRWVIPGREDIDVVNSCGPLKAALESYFPTELEAVARLHVQEQLISTDTDSFSDEVSFVDPEILDVFDFEIVEGDARLALSSNSSIIINETLAKKYFGREDPIGQSLTLSLGYLKRDYQVLAVMRDLPFNTHLDTQAMIQIDENDFVGNDGSWMFSSWNAANNHTYLKLKATANIGEIDRQIPQFTDHVVPDDDNNASEYTKLTTIPVSDIHLQSNGAGNFKAGGDGQTVLAFTVIALLIIIVAAINYVNLATARAGQRAKETAMRKVMGANRWQLLAQHLGESFLIVTFSVVLAILCVEIALPFFNRMLGINLVISIAEPAVSAGVFSAVIIIGLLSGLYPALMLSSFPPSVTLQSNQSTMTRGSVNARNVLVVFQITITVSLLVATTVVYAQLNYFHWLDRGFKSDKLLVVENVSHNDIGDIRTTLEKEVKLLPGVVSVSLSFEAPTLFSENNTSLRIPGESKEQSYQLGLTYVDHEYLNALQIPLLAGRFYDQDRSLDQMPSTQNQPDGAVSQGNLVINEQAVNSLNLGTPEEALGRVVERRFESDDGGAGKMYLTIIGVIGNTNLHSAKKTIRPEIYLVSPRFFNEMLVRYTGEESGILEQVRTVWHDILPDIPLEYFYVDQALESEFQLESSQASIFLGFAILTMVIGCLGLYGLAAFVTECRRQEMGIRKILGASIRDILTLLLGQFSKLVIAANLIAWPVVYLLMSDWLEQYPFRIGAGWIMVFCIIAGLLASVVVGMTVGSQAWGVARANPINAIRQE